MARLLATLVALLALGGCASVAVERLAGDSGDLPRRAEVRAVPFHPQEERYCGPAALATVLGWSGPAADQNAVAQVTFTPGREGSLGHDMVAAARRHGRLAVPVADLAGLLAELAAGHPVLVLQNLGLEWYPQWHYAVVVGYDLDAGTVALRSGRERRRVISLSTFERTWRRGGGWAYVVLPPGSLPAQAREVAVLRAAAALERAGRQREAAVAYAAALVRWPESVSAMIGRGNAELASGELAAAESAYRAAIERDPGAAVAWNNLAELLARRGRARAALAAARRAVELGGPHAAIFRATLDQIVAGTV